MAESQSDHLARGEPHRTPTGVTGGASNTPTHPRKRQKISLACEECRSRKVRCDGIRPQCTACSRKKRVRPCQYPTEPAGKITLDRRVIRSLQERLNQLEGRVALEPSQEIRAHRRDSLASSESTSRVSLQKTPQSPTSARVPVAAAATASPLPDQVPASLSSPSERQLRQPELQPPPLQHAGQHDEAEEAPEGLGPDEDAGSINAMGVARLTPDDKSPVAAGEFYGRSSATAFFSDIQGRLHHTNATVNSDGAGSGVSSHHAGTAPQRLGPRVRQRPGAIGSNPQPGFSSRACTQMDDHHLPPRHVADQLLDLYWQRVQCLYPYLHWPTFMRAYQRLWMSDAEIKSSPQLTGVGLGGLECSATVFYCALNVVFALGTQFSKQTLSPQEKKQRASPFARRARHLLRIDFLDHGDLALVQALLMMAHYLQSTNMPTRCWNIAGIAYRMAQGLGLHLEIPVSDRSMPTLTREMRKRVWYGCVCLDIVLGMTYGRPGLNSRKSSVSLPGLLDEEVSTPRSTDSFDYATAASTTAFYVETIKLYKILDRILGTIYDPWQESEAHKDEAGADKLGTEVTQQIALIMELDGELDRYEEDMADCMHWSCEPPEMGQDDILRRQRNVIRTRYLHTRILLHRPAFAQLYAAQAHTIDRPQKAPRRKERQLVDSFVERCSITCIETSQVLIDHISSTSKSADTGAPWFNAYYVYHSAMVLTLAEFCPSIRQQLNQDHLGRAWQQCRDFLERMIEHDAESYRYLRTLKDISKMINGDASGHGEAPTVGSLISNEQQGLLVNHITNPCLDPSMASWLGNTDAQFDMYMQMEGDGFDMEFLRDQSWPLSNVNPFLSMDTEWNEHLAHAG